MRVAALSMLLFVAATHGASPRDDGGPSLIRSQRAGRAAIAADRSRRVSDAEIRRRMITESIDAYPGVCACPYQFTRTGSQCGRRSAYDRGGGYVPLCYPSDISDLMVKSYRAENGLD